MKLLPALIAAGFCLTCTGVPAADDAPGAWLMATATDRLGDESSAWRYSFDAQFRYNAQGGGFRQVLLRPAIGYRLTNGITLFGGYAYAETDPFAPGGAQENRWWQQVGWSGGQFAGGRLAYRSRMEQRRLDRGDDTALRFRQQFRWTRPLASRRATEFIASVEPLLNLRDTDWGAKKGLDQVRLSLTFTLPLETDLRLEAGYMQQYVRRPGRDDQANHLAVIHLRL